MLKPSLVEKLLNTNVVFKKHPELRYVKVFENRKGYSIGVKYGDNNNKITPKESESLKETIKTTLVYASLDVNQLKIFYYRIFERQFDQ